MTRTRKNRRPSRPQESVRQDYLRVLGDKVDAALGLIVHDLVATGAMERGDAEAAVRIRAAIHLESQAESGLEVSAQETAVWVTESVQENLIEGMGTSPRLVTWPACPDHPNHPLWLLGSVDESGSEALGITDDPVWTCPSTNRAVAELGKL